MKIEYWPLERILPYPKNAKTHNDAAIQASIRDFKPDQPIVVDGAGVIIKGHGRLAAAKSLGLKDFPVIVRTDLTPAQVKAARIADNSCNKPGWDQELLKLELAEIPEIDLTIYGLDVEGLKIFNPETIDPPKLPDGDRAPFRQMTFTVHDDQFFEIEQAIKTAKEQGGGKSDVNENSNGNALSFICDSFNGAQNG